MNTVIGFACAMGVNMGFNAHHHKKDDCCNDKALKIFQADKAVPQANILVNPIFVTAFISSFYITDALYDHFQIPGIKYFFRGHHPPIPDIRIAIQSFQI